MGPSREPASAPFQDLLLQIRAAGIPVGISDMQAAAELGRQLLESGRWDELPVSLAALLSTQRRHTDQIERLVQLHLGQLVPPQDPGETARIPRPPAQSGRHSFFYRRTARIGVALLALLLTILGIWRGIRGTSWLRRSPVGAAPTPQASPNAPAPQPPAQALPPMPMPATQPTPLPQPSSWRDRGIRILPAVLIALGMSALGLGWLRQKRNRRRRTSVLHSARRQLELLPGPGSFVLRADRQLAPYWDARLIEEAATLLRQLQPPGPPGSGLDVERSTRRTSEQAGCPTLVFRRPAQRDPVRVIVERGPRMRPWLRKCSALVEGLADCGIAIELLSTEEVERALRGEAGPRLHSDAACTLLISLGPSDGSDAAAPLLRWLRQQGPFCWLHPVSQPALWSQSLRQQRQVLNLFPLDPDGLMQALRQQLSPGRQTLPARIESPISQAAENPDSHAQDLKRLLSLVQQCGPLNLASAELLRQRLLPQLSDAALLYVLAAQRSWDVDHLDSRGMTAWRRLGTGDADAPDSDQLLQAQGLMLQVLADSEPPPQTLAHQRWQLRQHIQEVRLWSQDRPRAEQALSALVRLSQGPLCEEVLGALRSLEGHASPAAGQRLPMSGETFRRAAPPDGLEQRLRRIQSVAESALAAGHLPGQSAPLATALSPSELVLATTICALAISGSASVFRAAPWHNPSPSPLHSEFVPPPRAGSREAEAQIAREVPLQSPEPLPRSTRDSESPRQPSPARQSPAADPPVRQRPRRAATRPAEVARPRPEAAGSGAVTAADASAAAAKPQRDVAADRASATAERTEPEADPKSGARGEVAQGMVRITGERSFLIDHTEVSQRAYQRCVAAGVCRPPGQFSTECGSGRAGFEGHPVNCVDQRQARAYCAWLGKRLPRQAEWQRAAVGAEPRPYPWGDAPPSTGTCWQQRESTCAVGVSPQDRSAEGVSDLAGNVREWMDEQGVVRGGAWHDHEPQALSGNASRLLLRPEDQSGSVGFRCARD